MQAWAPTHATLFFAVPAKIDRNDYLHMGSLGGGINFADGTTTTVTQASTTTIYFNGEKITGLISHTAYELYQKYTGITKSVKIEHETKMRTGSGVSTSGAGAIGVVLAADALFDTQLEENILLQLAHQAEIMCYTGLGSVIGQSVAGIEIRRKVGAPGYGKVIGSACTDEFIVIFKDPLSTGDVLTSDAKVQLLTKVGLETLAEISDTPTASDIILAGQKFMQKCGLATDSILQYVHELATIGEPFATMAMIGETLIVLPQNKERVIAWAQSHGLYYVSTAAAQRKPHVL